MSSDVPKAGKPHRGVGPVDGMLGEQARLPGPVHADLDRRLPLSDRAVSRLVNCPGDV